MAFTVVAMERDEGDVVMLNLLWGLALILVLFWVLGFAFHVGGGLIHLLLVVALITIVVRLVAGSRTNPG